MPAYTKGSWWSELISSYFPSDFDGWIDKWMEKEGLVKSVMIDGERTTKNRQEFKKYI